MNQNVAMPMNTYFTNIIVFFLAFVLLFPCNDSVEHGEFDYAAKSSKGPEKWGQINPEWDACLNGKKQSPIDIQNKNLTVNPELGVLKKNYKATHASVANKGHYIMVSWDGDAGGIYINGTNYNLKQCHWHSPAEHTIDGSRYDLELHMFHESTNGTRAVVGILYRFGKADPFLAEVIHDLTNGSTATNMGIMNPRDIRLGSKRYYRYEGSLTTPPCTEGVIWTILKKVKTVSKEQISALKGAVVSGFEENARPTQAINDRPIFIYGPKDSKSPEL